MPLDQRQIDVLNALAATTPEVAAQRPDLFAHIQEYADNLRVAYPDVSDDDLASIMMDNATGMSYILATTNGRGLTGALLNLITMWGQGAVELSKLTRGA